MSNAPGSDIDMPSMGLREFLRGGYQSVQQPIQITRFGKLIGVFTPLETGAGRIRVKSKPTHLNHWFSSRA
jgi:hypothetical protein